MFQCVRTKMQNSFQRFYQTTSEPNFQLKSQMINLSNPNVCNFVKKVILFAFTKVLLRFFFEKCQIFGILRKSHFRSKLKLFVIKSMQNWAPRCSDRSFEKNFAFLFWHHWNNILSWIVYQLAFEECPSKKGRKSTLFQFLNKSQPNWENLNFL